MSRPTTLQEAYVLGLEDGIRAYAWHKDGVQYVGTTGRTLADALENARNGRYPPQPNLARAEPDEWRDAEDERLEMPQGRARGRFGIGSMDFSVAPTR